MNKAPTERFLHKAINILMHSRQVSSCEQVGRTAANQTKPNQNISNTETVKRKIIRLDENQMGIYYTFSP